MATFQGEEVPSVGHAVKLRVRDYLRERLAEFAPHYDIWARNSGDGIGYDVKLDSEFDADPVPNGRPLCVVNTTRRNRKPLGRPDNPQLGFVLELRVIADPGSGAGDASGSNNLAPASDEILSDDIETIFDSQRAREELRALGLQGVMVGERTEQTRAGLHTNSTPLEFCVESATTAAA